MHGAAGQLPDFNRQAVLGSTIGAYGSAGRLFFVFAGSGPEPAHSGLHRFHALLRRADRETLDPSKVATGSQGSERIVCEPFTRSSGTDVICAWNDRSKDRFGVIVGVSATARSGRSFTQDAIRAMRA